MEKNQSVISDNWFDGEKKKCLFSSQFLQNPIKCDTEFLWNH